MLDSIIHFSVHNKFIISLFTLALVLWGVYSLSRLPIDALPDITNNQVQILTLSPTLATQEVEQLITYPIEQAVKSVPRVVELRSTSKFGLSAITVVFEEDADIFWARAQISERLKEAGNNIAPGLGTPEMAPVSSGLGEIYQYVVFAKPGFEQRISSTDLRTIQDWIIKPQFTGTRGIAEVNTLGGLKKEYEISVHPDKLHSMNTSMAEIFEALQRNNENTGGAYIDKKPVAYFIRGIGMVSSLEDVGKIVVHTRNGTPVLVRDLGEVRFGSAVRYGASTKDGKGEVVTGTVMMLKGENSAEVVARVKEKVEQIRKTLPEGVEIEPYLDRTKMVDNAISTVRTNLLEGALIVIFILVLLIGNWRAGLIVASVIPLSLLFAVSLMRVFGVSGNLMSLGAIDFGLIVDGAVIIVEAIVHRLQIRPPGTLTAAEMDSAVYDAARKIRGSAAFGEIIILIVYLPILALTGIEGKMFAPMAQTVSFAILGAFILSLTYVPMMSAWFLDKKTGHTANLSDRIIAFCYRVYQPLLAGAMRARGLVTGVSLGLFILALFIFNQLGGEFIPTLEEGDIATHIITPPGSSLSQEIEATTKAEAILKAQFPEVIQVVSKIGSAEIPTDPMPMEVADVMVIMKPKAEWTSATTTQEMMAKMDEALNDLPGITTEFNQPVQMRFNELMTGVRSDVAVKIFGEDIDRLAGLAEEALPLIQSVDGVEDARAEQVSGLPQITVRYNKDKLALYGLNISDINQTIRTGFAGEKAGTVYEGEKRFDLVVRLASDERQDIGDLQHLYLPLPSGGQIPLMQVAEVTYERGTASISREDGKRRIVIGFNVRGRDVESVVTEIRDKLEARLTLPPGYYTTYGGQFENLVEANKRLAVAVPVALALIFVLLFFTFGSIRQSLLIFTAIPLSAIGGVLALWMRGMPFSISAGVGFIALFGVAVLNGIVLIGYFNQLKQEGIEDIQERIREGTRVRLRPVIMTAAVASLGFLPMALSHGAGAEVQKPLATVVIGGLISATLLTLVVLPVLYALLEEKFPAKGTSGMAALGMLAGLLFCQPLMGQTPPSLTLEQALEQGYLHHPQMQAVTLEWEAAQANIRAAGMMPKTQVNALLGQTNSIHFDENIAVSQEIPNPAHLRAKREMATGQAALGQQQLSLTRQELTFRIRQSWYQTIHLQTVYQLLLQEDTLVREFVRAATLRHKTGEGTLLEQTTAENRHQQLQQRMQQTLLAIAAEKATLAQWMNLPGDFVLAETPSLVPQASLADTALLRENPLLQYARQQFAVAEAAIQVEKTAALPDFTAGYFIQSLAGNQEVNGQIRSFSSAPRFQGIQAGISVPLFYGGYRAATEAAALRAQAQQKHSEAVQAQLKSQLQQQIRQYLYWKNNLTYFTSTALPNATAIRTQATKAYLHGEIGYVEYAQALQTSLEIQQSYREAVNTTNQTAVSLLFLLNR